MKYSFLSLIFLLSSCAIQGEVFRLQQRVKAWNSLLPQEQKMLFSANDTNALGLWLDQQEATEPEFAQKLKNLREDEAIMSFSGVQTAHFFYNTLLKDLAKFSYAELIKHLDAKGFQKFLESPDGSALIENKNITSILDNARSLYGMENFSDAEILKYHRTKSLPAHLYVVVYDTLAFAAKQKVILWGTPQPDYAAVAEILQGMKKNIKSRRPQSRKIAKAGLEEWDYILSRALVPNMPPEDFLKIIIDKIVPEMDTEVYKTTLMNLHERFNVPYIQ